MGGRETVDQHSVVAAVLVVAVVFGYVLIGYLSAPSKTDFATVRRRANRCIARIAVSTVLGVLVGWCFYALHFLIEGFMAVDVRFYFQWYAVFGGSIGFIVSVVWGLFGSSPNTRGGRRSD